MHSDDNKLCYLKAPYNSRTNDKKCINQVLKEQRYLPYFHYMHYYIMVSSKFVNNQASAENTFFAFNK